MVQCVTHTGLQDHLKGTLRRGGYVRIPEEMYYIDELIPPL